MSEPSHPRAPRKNPFWTYRDPQSGRWVTLMTAAQCQQVADPVFAPKTRQPVEPNLNYSTPADTSTS